MYFHESHIFRSGGASNYRIPSIVATKHGTVLAFCNDRRNTSSDHADEMDLVMCRKEPGGDWSEPIILNSMPGWAHMINAAVYDEITDTIFLSASRNAVMLNEFGSYTDEERRAARARAEAEAAAAGVYLGAYLLVSTDDGRTFTERPHVITPTHFAGGTFTGFSHGSAPGIQLQYGKYAGRLLCPARFMTGHYTNIDGLQKYGFNNAVWSDDHGETWHSGMPVQPGTGEGTLIERADGTILYNSRAYYHDGKRYLAISRDGGETFGEFSTDAYLMEEKNCGCNASFLRAETEAGALTLFANPRAQTRRNMTVCISRDDGASWCAEKQIRAGQSGYSALAYRGGRFYLLYEHGEQSSISDGLSVAEFDAAWLLA